MATLLCKCNTILRDDDPDLSYLVLSNREFDVDESPIALLGKTKQLWRCPTCGRLWVFWEDVAAPTEYLRVDD